MLDEAQKRRIRLYLLIAAMLLAAFALGIWEPRRQVGPVYLGKALSQWLEEVPDGWDSPVEGRQKPAVAKAVRAMGTNALPTLIKMMEARDWPPKPRLLWLASNLLHLDLMRHTNPAERQNVRALFGFCALGTNANPAVPALTNLLLRRGDDCTAVALAYMSPEGVLAVSQVLTNQDIIRTNNAPRARFTAFQVLRRLTWVAQQADPPFERSRLELLARLAAPSLLQCMNDPYPRIRVAAAMRAVDLGLDRDKAVTVLTACLTNPDPWVSSYAAASLSALGPAATSAVPPLVKASREHGTSVASANTNALPKTSPAPARSGPLTRRSP